MTVRLDSRCQQGEHDQLETMGGGWVCARAGCGVTMTAPPEPREEPTTPTPIKGRVRYQWETVLEALRQGPVCSFTFYDNAGLSHRLAARIHDLKTKHGYTIVSKTCSHPKHHHTGAAVEYRLV